MKKLLILFMIMCFSYTTKAQSGYEYSEGITILYTTVFEGDTIPYVNIPEVDVIGLSFDTQQDEYWYNYYLKRVQKVYPYFQIAEEVIYEMEEQKADSKKKEFKKYKKERKKELMNEFEKELRQLKTSEGKVLVKMINRKTGTPFFDLIKEYNGGIKAWAYNIVAKRYDYDLKSPYDIDLEENKFLEMAIRTVEKTYAGTYNIPQE